MSVELRDIRDFLAQCAPFSSLPPELLDSVPARLSSTYVRRGHTIVRHGDNNGFLYIIRAGAVDVLDQDGTLLDRRDAGESCGYSTLRDDSPSQYTMQAVEDTLLLKLGREDFLDIAGSDQQFERYYASLTTRIGAAAEALRGNSASRLLHLPVGDCMTPNPVTAPATLPIRDAAVVMTEENISCLLIVTENGELEGIITDKDLRRRVVAAGLDPAAPLSRIMTPHPLSVTPDTLVFQAMLTMADKHIHHAPVIDGHTLRGIVTTADMMRQLRSDPIFATATIARARDVAELAAGYEAARDVAAQFIRHNSAAADVSALVTVASDALAQRALTLAEDKLGPPPVPYAFAVLGSHGRGGMAIASDQDNALVLDNSYDPGRHGAYFEALAAETCSTLATAGLPLCPGDMMATNPAWRLTAEQWMATFHGWITAPEPQALLHAQVFFDMRGVHGATELVQDVHSYAVATARAAGRLHAHLAALAARREPPLSVFRGLVVDSSGSYVNTLDVKKGGTAAIVQIARLCALVNGIEDLSTRARLEKSAGTPALSAEGAGNLLGAFDFLTALALRHQEEQLMAGGQPDYHVAPHSLSAQEREHLRDAFTVIKRMQKALTTKYPVHSI